MFQVAVNNADKSMARIKVIFWRPRLQAFNCCRHWRQTLKFCPQRISSTQSYLLRAY